MVNSRSLLELNPVFRNIAGRWIQLCKVAGIDILVVSTYRDIEYQNYLYSLGRTKKGAIVTNARGGESEHQKRTALDFCVMNGNKCAWDDKDGFKCAGLLAESLGLKWAGRWAGKLRETGHIQQ